MTLPDLLRILSPPLVPLEVGSPARWREVEERIGAPLPSDYKAFIDAFGSGRIDDFMSVLNPFAANRYQNFFHCGEDIVRAEQQFRAVHPDAALPLPAFPAPGGVLPFAVTDNGDTLYWLTAGPSEKWAVVVYSPRDQEHETYRLTATDFIAKVLTRQLACSLFPADWPAVTPTFAAGK